MRAREAVAGVARPLDSGSPLPAPLPPDPEPAPIADLAESQGPVTVPPPSDEGLGFRTESGEGDSESPDEGVLPGSPADRDPEGEAPAAPDLEGEGAAEGGDESEAPQAPASGGGGGAGDEGAVSLNTASFEQLRNAGLSVTQTGRVLAHRERAGGFTSVDELDEIPGFPQEFLDQVKPKLTA
jgi:competence protein ComEA